MPAEDLWLQRHHHASEVVAAIGREGSDWFSHICKAHGIETEVGTVDIGVRVEVRDEVMDYSLLRFQDDP